MVPETGKTADMLIWAADASEFPFSFFSNSLLPSLLHALLSTRILIMCCNITGTDRVAVEF